MAFVNTVVGGRTLGRNGSAATCARPARRATVLREKVYDVQIELDGELHNVPVSEDVTFLEAIEEQGLTVDSSCRAGVCMTCAAKIITGSVDIGEAALAEEVKNSGYVLTCSAYPRSEGIKLKMQEFNDAYDMQYGQYEKLEEKKEKEKSGGLFGFIGSKK